MDNEDKKFRILINTDPLKTLISSSTPTHITIYDTVKDYPTQEQEIDKLKKSGLYEKYLQAGRDISTCYKVDSKTKNSIVRRFERGANTIFGNIDTIWLPFLKWDTDDSLVGFIFPTYLGYIGPFYYHTHEINTVYKLMNAIDNFYRYPLQDKIIEFFFGPGEKVNRKIREVAKNSPNKWIDFDWSKHHEIMKNVELSDWSKYPTPKGNWIKPFWLGSYFLETLYDVSPDFMYLELVPSKKRNISVRT